MSKSQKIKQKCQHEFKRPQTKKQTPWSLLCVSQLLLAWGLPCSVIEIPSDTLIERNFLIASRC